MERDIYLETVDRSFNGQILVDKLMKLNSSQQSIETLSHWCIFHRKKAKQVVETWEREFYSSPRDQRISFLYLANDILQNSRRKGLEFVAEFWRVLPGALKDVVENGGEFGRNAASRLVGIWEERKVFISRGQTLKEELLGEQPTEIRDRKAKGVSYTLRNPLGDVLAKLISSCERVYSQEVDVEALFEKCQEAMSSVDEIEKQAGRDFEIDGPGGSRLVELQEKNERLKECIEQLKLAESSKSNLLFNIREALNETEFEIHQIHGRIQVAQARYERSDNLCQRLRSSFSGTDQGPRESTLIPFVPLGYFPETEATTEGNEESRPVDAVELPAPNCLEAANGGSTKEGPDAKRSKIENGSNGVSLYSPSHPWPPLPSLPPPVQPEPPPMPPPPLVPLQPPLLLNNRSPATHLISTSDSPLAVPFNYGFALPPSLPWPLGFNLPSYLGHPDPYSGLWAATGPGIVSPSETPAQSQAPPRMTHQREAG